MRKLFVVLCFVILMLEGVLPSYSYAQPEKKRPFGEYDAVPNKIRTETHMVYWRNAASPDTTVRLFTAAAQLNDTSRDAYWVGGATTISVVDSFGVSEDSALVRVFAQFSNDKSAWFRYLAGTGVDQSETAGSRTTTANAAFDSSGALDTSSDQTGGNSYAISLASPPTYSNWMRLIAAKYLSAATDSMRLRTTITIHFGDE